MERKIKTVEKFKSRINLNFSLNTKPQTAIRLRLFALKKPYKQAILTFIYHTYQEKQNPILYIWRMKNFWKIIVFACLFIQMGYAYDTNQDSPISFQKKENTSFDKESLGTSEFVQFSIERGAVDLKHNNRVLTGIGHYSPTEFQSLSFLTNNTLKIVLSDQDIDRYNSVSILLFPFHYFW